MHEHNNDADIIPVRERAAFIDVDFPVSEGPAQTIMDSQNTSVWSNTFQHVTKWQNYNIPGSPSCNADRAMTPPAMVRKALIKLCFRATFISESSRNM